MAEAKNTVTSTKKRGNPQYLKAPWKKGQSGNPSGRKLGQRNRKTIIMDALIRLAEKKKMTADELEEELQVAGLDRALKGSFFHWQELNAGLYGKVTDKLDLTSGGKSLADVIAAASHARKTNGGAKRA